MLLHVVFSVQKNKNLFESIILKIKSTPFQTFVRFQRYSKYSVILILPPRQKGNYYMANLGFTSTENQYISDFYGQKAAGFLKIWGGKNKTGVFPYGKTFCNEHAKDILKIDKLPSSNLFMSVSTFYGKKKATIDNIRSVQCIPIDIDYKFKDKRGDLLDPLVVWDMLQKDIINKRIFFPMPTYIEYGHRLRLIYLLNEGGVILPRVDKNRRKKILNLLRRIQEELINTINALNPLYHAEYNSYTSFVRVPASLNTIWEKRFDPNDFGGKPTFHVDEEYYVQIRKIANGRRWDFHDLADEVLPKLPEWYRDKKVKKNTPGIHISTNDRNISSMLTSRMHFLEILQDNGYDIGFREVMCFMYWNFALQSGYSETEAQLAALEFNRGFKHPMKEKEVISLSRPRKLYYYRMNTILSKLCVSEDLATACGYDTEFQKDYQKLYMRKYRMYKKKKAGISRKQKSIKKLSESANKLRNKGIKLADIARKLSVSLSTVKRYIAAADPI